MSRTAEITRKTRETEIELARRLLYVTPEQTRDLDAELERVRQMLYGMRREHLRRLAIAGATVTSFVLCVVISCL